MAWVRLDEHFPEHPKLANLGSVLPMAGWLHVCALCYCNRHLTDGRFPRQVVASWWPWHDHTLDGEAVTAYDLAGDLVAAGIWEAHEEDGLYAIHDYLDYQPARAEVLRVKRLRARAGREGGNRRQAHRKQLGQQTPSNHVANGEAKGQQTPSNHVANGEAKEQQTPSTPRTKFKPDPDPDPGTPPNPPSRGADPDEPRPLRAIPMRPAALRKRAEDLRATAWGRCPHDPSCVDYETCIATIAGDLEARTRGVST